MSASSTRGGGVVGSNVRASASTPGGDVRVPVSASGSASTRRGENVRPHASASGSASPVQEGLGGRTLRAPGVS